jgi:hypothetical protein
LYADDQVVLANLEGELQILVYKLNRSSYRYNFKNIYEENQGNSIQSNDPAK